MALSKPTKGRTDKRQNNLCKVRITPKTRNIYAYNKDQRHHTEKKPVMNTKTKQIQTNPTGARKCNFHPTLVGNYRSTNQPTRRLGQTRAHREDEHTQHHGATIYVHLYSMVFQFGYTSKF